MFFVYIVECSDKSVYVGCTNNLEKRIVQHNTSKSGAHYTKIRRPVVLKYSETFSTYSEARKREGEIKSWPREKKLALIEFMQTKVFGDKKIIIRQDEKSEIKEAKKFQDFINSLVKEDAKILMNREITLKDEVAFLEARFKAVKSKKKVFLIAEHDGNVVGTIGIELGIWRKNHIGKLGIAIKDGYRGMGLGKYLVSEVIKLAKKDLKPKPRMIQLEVYANNKPAIELYKKLGFKMVAKLPKQIQYKGKLVDEFVMVLYL